MPMTWKLVPWSAVTPSLWRNGGGVTRELIAWPDPQAWQWRVSVAEVASSGPFSRFDGVQRWLAILSGAGVYLVIGEQSLTLTPHDAPLSFSGADPANCELIDGPVQDLNLMLRRDDHSPQVRSQMQRISGSAQMRLEEACTVAIYNSGPAANVRLDGASSVLASDTLAWQTLVAGSTIEIEAANAVLMAFGAGVAGVVSDVT